MHAFQGSVFPKSEIQNPKSEMCPCCPTGPKFVIVAKQKFYVVWKGRVPGVYNTWSETEAQVKGVDGAQYKSFDRKPEADAAFKSNYWKYVQRTTPAAKPKSAVGDYLRESVAVDAACSGNPGDMEYQGVYVASGQQLFHIGPLEEGTNNIGEFLALVHALAMLKHQNKPNLPIYSDSYNAQLWVKKGKCNTKLAQTPRNKKIFELIDRAEAWLATNKITNPIIKWETEVWGEIPADFGRK